MSNPVSARFVECYQALCQEKKVPSARQFAMALNFHPQAFHQILKGHRDVTIELIRQAVEHYGFNASFLFTGEGNMFVKAVVDEKPENRLSEIRIVKHRDRAAYIQSKTDESSSADLDVMTVYSPSLSYDDYQAFEFKGQYLRPCLHDGDIVICKRLTAELQMTDLREGYVYCFVTSTRIMITRVIDKLDDSDTLVLSNPGMQHDQELLMDLSKITEAWSVVLLMTADVPSPQNIRFTTERKITNLGEILEKQNQTILSLSSTVDKLLKQNRSLRV